MSRVSLNKSQYGSRRVRKISSVRFVWYTLIIGERKHGRVIVQLSANPRAIFLLSFLRACCLSSAPHMLRLPDKIIMDAFQRGTQ